MLPSWTIWWGHGPSFLVPNLIFENVYRFVILIRLFFSSFLAERECIFYHHQIPWRKLAGSSAKIFSLPFHPFFEFVCHHMCALIPRVKLGSVKLWSRSMESLSNGSLSRMMMMMMIMLNAVKLDLHTCLSLSRFYMSCLYRENVCVFLKIFL